MKITFLGDVMCEQNQITQHRKGELFDFFDMFAHCEELKEADWVVANLETPIAVSQCLTFEDYSFNAPEQLVLAMKMSGIDMVTAANNHCLDRGTKGLLETIERLKKSGLEVVGIHDMPENSYVIREIEGIKVGFLDFTYGTNAFHNHCYLKNSEKYMVDMLQEQELNNYFIRILCTSQNIGVKAIRKFCRSLNWFQLKKQLYERRSCHYAQEKRLKEQIEQCRFAGAELTFVCLHIGGQYNEEPMPYTIEMCEKVLKWGGSAVIANHEHVIHSVRISSEYDQKLIAYSLGNFLSEAGNRVAPFDRDSEFSLAIHIYAGLADGQRQVEYAFSLYKSGIKDGKVFTQLVTKWIEQENNEMIRKQLIEKNQELVNKVMGTKGIQYSLQSEYKLGVKENGGKQIWKNNC